MKENQLQTVSIPGVMCLNKKKKKSKLPIQLCKYIGKYLYTV